LSSTEIAPSPALPARPVSLGAGRRLARLRYRLSRSPLIAVGALLSGLIVLLAVFAPLVAPYDPTAQIVQPLLRPGTPGYLLGSDEVGRDVLSRLIYGARVSLYVGLLSVAIALGLGATVGIVAGYAGGWLDNLLMRLMDVLFSLPTLVFAIAITAILGPNLTNAVIAIGIVYLPTFARIARGPTLAVIRLPYIEAARSMGAPVHRILLRHVLPNIAAPLMVQTTLALSTAILTEASLSFLGVGAQPPTPSWGLMLNAARQYMLLDAWIAILPGLAIALTVLGFNLLGDGLRDALDPRLNK
jgi:peptide/nickel transport system permease protein